MEVQGSILYNKCLDVGNLEGLFKKKKRKKDVIEFGCTYT